MHVSAPRDNAPFTPLDLPAPANLAGAPSTRPPPGPAGPTDQTTDPAVSHDARTNARKEAARTPCGRTTNLDPALVYPYPPRLWPPLYH
ncbi:hypothetical protein F511_22177 [Dorcoceras hygrometricum]|uniref:Uncharacterized protein n=1 Tax=Dorcoceras hygrometricum TaxID=472368 RepID=A0A2Z7ASA7_9LAMI|nr:hypothetical protein F511_22177 [Dorcoceras hygrometricum]